MPVVETDLRSGARESGKTRPQRSMDARKLVITTETSTGWIKKEFLGLMSFHTMAQHAGITATVKGRWNGDAATEHTITDKDGAAKTLDLDQAATGHSFIIDEAGLCDEVEIVFSGAISGTFVVAFGA
jgi:hypothetical protein